MNKSEFLKLLGLCEELSQAHPQGLIFIGGIAVYLHATNNERVAHYAQFTHDADFFISMADMSDLRHQEEVTPNRRLNKHQIIKGGFEFDVYTERQSGLIVPFDEISALCLTYGQMRVACLEHLLVLKLEAYRDRKGSSKGAKDAGDIIQLGLLANDLGGLNSGICTQYLTDEHLALLLQIPHSPQVVVMAEGNAMQAKQIREKIKTVFTQLLQSQDGDSTRPPSMH